MDTNIISVSIVLPTYNGVRWIRRAIESVLTQTFTDWELMVLDDGSTEDISSLIPSDPRIIYIKYDTNTGIQRTLNRGLERARGKYIARIDDDDVWYDSQKLAHQVAFLDSHPEHVLVGTGVVVVNEGGKELTRYLLPVSDERIRWNILQKNCFIHSSVMYRREKFLYSESKKTRHAEDYDLWLRLGLEGKLANLPSYSVRFMARTNSLTARNRRIQAWHVLQCVWRYRHFYPRPWKGLCIGMIRYLFFLSCLTSLFSTELFYRLQSKQKSI